MYMEIYNDNECNRIVTTILYNTILLYNILLYIRKYMYNILPTVILVMSDTIFVQR
jgi:hypothetical protein